MKNAQILCFAIVLGLAGRCIAMNGKSWRMTGDSTFSHDKGVFRNVESMWIRLRPMAHILCNRDDIKRVNELWHKCNCLLFTCSEDDFSDFKIATTNFQSFVENKYDEQMKSYGNLPETEESLKEKELRKRAKKKLEQTRTEWKKLCDLGKDKIRDLTHDMKRVVTNLKDIMSKTALCAEKVKNLRYTAKFTEDTVNKVNEEYIFMKTQQILQLLQEQQATFYGMNRAPAGRPSWFMDEYWKRYKWILGEDMERKTREVDLAGDDMASEENYDDDDNPPKGHLNMENVFFSP